MSDPGNVGISAERIRRIEDAVEQHLGEEKLAGVVTLVSRRGETVHLGSYGLSYREQNRPMTTDAIFRLYSMTKPITMAAVLILFERGLLRLNDPVSRFLPAFSQLKVVQDETDPQSPLVDPVMPVTIKHLLTHTSGLTYHFNENGIVEQMYRDSSIFENMSLAELADRIAKIPLAFQPGTMWRYSVAHDVAARVVEVASGKSYGRFLDEEIFNPLGMTDTGFGVPAEKWNRLTAEYGLADITDPKMTGTEWQKLIDAGAKPRLLRAPGEGSESDGETHRGGHGLYSTAEDYLKFCRMLLGRGALGGARILSRKTVEIMTSNHVAAGLLPPDALLPGIGFGLGVRVVLDPAATGELCSSGEHGWSGAAGTFYWIDPAEELIGIFMTQFQPGGHFSAAADFRTAAYQAIDD